MTGRKKRGQGKSKDGKDDEEKADDDKADDDKADDDAEKVGFCCTSRTNSNVCLNGLHVFHVILLLLRATAATVTKHVPTFTCLLVFDRIVRPFKSYVTGLS